MGKQRNAGLFQQQSRYHLILLGDRGTCLNTEQAAEENANTASIVLNRTAGLRPVTEMIVGTAPKPSHHHTEPNPVPFYNKTELTWMLSFLEPVAPVWRCCWAHSLKSSIVTLFRQSTCTSHTHSVFRSYSRFFGSSVSIRRWTYVRYCRRLGRTQKVTRNVFDCDQSNYSSHIIFSYFLVYFYPRTKQEEDRMQRYGHSKFFKKAASRIRSADPENPTLEPNMKWIGWPVAEIWPFIIFQDARLVVGRSSIYTYTDVIYRYSSSLRDGSNGKPIGMWPWAIDCACYRWRHVTGWRHNGDVMIFL